MSELIKTTTKTSFRCDGASIIIEESERGVYIWNNCMGTGHADLTYDEALEHLKNEYDVIIQTSRSVTTTIEQNINIKSVKYEKRNS